MNPSNQSLVALFGRIFVAAIFVLSGMNKMGDFAGTTAMMMAVGLPMAELLLVMTILIEVIGGMMLVLGWQTRVAALLLLLFMIPVTLVFHNPWAIAESAVVQQQMIHLLKNLAIMGGLMNLLAFGPGAYSMEARQGNRMATGLG